MPKTKLTDHELITCHATYLAVGRSWAKTGEKLGLTGSSVQRRLEAYRDRFAGMDSPAQAEEYVDEDEPQADATPLEDVLAGMRKKPWTLAEIAEARGLSAAHAMAELYEAQAKGVNVTKLGDRWSVQKTPALRPTGVDSRHEVFSDDKNEFRFGFVTDNHIGSKYARLDVLNDLYDRFAKRGITQVFNAGNYIDGEARFNTFDLEVHGMDAQLRFLAQEYPQRDGMTTFFVAGDDHEGWYGAKNGIDIGRWTERVMQENGREDFRYLGYMEADVDLVNTKTEKSARMRVVHPGGGSAYAVSYTMQKLCESYEGGDKPAVVLAGHYHKMEILNYRNVWCIQGGTTEDQTPFMRKKKLEAHVGGIIVTLEQDPRTGAIVRCNDMYRYFNRDYYRVPGKQHKERFSYGGKVTMPARSLGGV